MRKCVEWGGVQCDEINEAELFLYTSFIWIQQTLFHNDYSNTYIWAWGLETGEF